MATGGSYFFIRPRRFGKMLLINSLKTIAEGPQYKSYFSKTRICKEDMKDDDGNFLSNEGLITNIPEKYNWPKYPVMHFDFRPLSSRSSLVDTLSELWEQLLNIVEKYGLESTNMKVQKAIEYVNNESYLYQEPIPTDLETKITKKSDACLKLMELIMKAMVTLGNGYKEEIVILIDEFDSIYQSKFAIRYQQAEQDRKAEKYVSPFTEFMQNFYGKFKDNNTLIHLKFITGVTMLHIDKLYSPLLDTENISTNSSYASLVGYTKDDIEELFSDSLFRDLYEGACTNSSLQPNIIPGNTNNDNTNTSNTTTSSITSTPLITRQSSHSETQITDIKKAVMKELAYWYDGYRFADTDVKIFNPMSVNLAFKNGIFKLYWFYNTSNNFKWEILEDNIEFFKIFERMRGVREIKETILIATESDCKGGHNKCISLMYQTGLLTITNCEKEPSGEMIYTLCFPNHEIRMVYADAVEMLMQEELEKHHPTYLKEFYRHFKRHEWEQFVVAVYKSLGRELYGSTDPLKEVEFERMFRVIMCHSGIEIEKKVVVNHDNIVDGVYRTHDKLYIFEYKVDPYLFGPRRKFDGLNQACYRYAPYLENENTEETIIIGINFLSKLSSEKVKKRPSDINGDKYLTRADYRNVCNIGQFIVMAWGRDGKQKYIKEIKPNRSDNPYVEEIEVNNNDWDTNARLHAEDYQAKQEEKALKKQNQQQISDTSRNSKDIGKKSKKEDITYVKIKLAEAMTHKKKKQPGIRNIKPIKK